MGKRKPDPFVAARDAVDEREMRVVTATVTPTFTADDALKWMVRADAIEKLRAAFTVARRGYETLISAEGYMLPSGRQCTVTLDVDHMGILVPSAAAININEAHGANLVTVLEEVYQIKQQWDKVRKVVQWFKDKEAKPAAMRYYWPTMLSLMPESSAIHEADGIRYTPINGIQEIIPLLRETAAIVTASTLAPKVKRPDKTTVSVQFSGPHSTRTYPLI